MNAQMLVLIVLLIALGAMVYVVGMPWLTPKPQKIVRKGQHRRSRGSRD